MSERIEAAALVQRARAEGWAVGQFNMSNLETLQAIAAAATEARAPVMIGVTMGTIRHAGLDSIAATARVAKAQSPVPLLLHLDHGPDLATIAACIERGWDSVMIDASSLPYTENVAMVREVVAMAHPLGVAVEAQIGQTWEEEGEGRTVASTEPEEARAFVRATGVDYIAVSIGNTPGQTAGEAPIDVPLLGEIATAADVPIVMHGGTSVPDAVMREAIALGVAKVNIDTAIRLAVTEALTAYYRAEAPGTDPRVALRLAREAAQRAVAAKIALFGAAGKAA
jgi:ketose-bisphosphate aldolase